RVQGPRPIVYRPRFTMRHAPKRISPSDVERWVREHTVFGPPDTEIDGDFFGTLEGQPDDVIGTYTGTANALIELAPHVAAFLLRAYGAQTAAQVELGTGVFGSF